MIVTMNVPTLFFIIQFTPICTMSPGLYKSYFDIAPLSVFLENLGKEKVSLFNKQLTCESFSWRGAGGSSTHHCAQPEAGGEEGAGGGAGQEDVTTSGILLPPCGSGQCGHWLR